MKSTGVLTKYTTDGPINDVLNAPITIDEITVAVRNLKNNKASGIDSIPAEFYKYSNGALLEPITILFNKVFESGQYPLVWCEGMINPLHKQGSKLAPENYRKITIISALGKLFEIVMNNRLVFTNNALNLDDPFQNGFIRNSRATDNAFILNALIDKSAASKCPLFVCYVDFKAAFDRVNRAALLYKMLKKGIGGKFIKIVRSMFTSARSRVKWGHHLSAKLQNLHGVLQGGVLSPTLFNMFLSDINEYLDKQNGITVGDMVIFYLLFADDLILTAQTSAGLQSLIHGLEVFCKQWQVEVNLVKTKYTIFNKNYLVGQDVRNFVYNNRIIEETDEYKYVGTIFSNKRDRFQKNVSAKIDSARKAIYAARKMAREAVGSQLPMELYLKIFDTQIRPILDFGCEVWSNGKLSAEIEKVHTDYLKQTLGVKQQTPHLAIYGETGRYPLHIKQQEMLLKYWLRLLSLDKENPLYKVYIELVNLDKLGHKTWCMNIKSILENIDLFHLWDNQEQLTDKNDHLGVMRDMKNRLCDRYSTYWENAVIDTQKHAKLRTYRLFKVKHCKEPYISIYFNNVLKKCISKFRVSSHRLGIETGRYDKKPAEERICVHCPGQHIDNEIHFLTECVYHSQDRNLLYDCAKLHVSGFSEMHDNLDIFKGIMTCHKKEVIIALGKFLHSGFTKRENSTVTQH